MLPDTAWEYRAISWNAAGESYWSGTTTGRTYPATPGAWRFSPVRTGGYADAYYGGNVQLLLGPSGEPHAVYSEGPMWHPYSLFHSAWDGKDWLHDAVEQDNPQDWHAPSADFDPDGVLHVFYRDTPSQAASHTTMRHATLGAGGWTVEEVLDESACIEPNLSHMGIDGGGDVHVAVASYDCGYGVFYLHRDGDGWTWAQIGTDTEMFGSASLALDPAGEPHIAWNEPGPTAPYRQVRHAWHTAAGWGEELVEEGNSLGYAEDMLIDAEDRVHLTYTQTGSGDSVLKYAVRDGAGWTIEAVGSFADPPDTALAVDSEGRTWIAGDGILLHREGGAWVREPPRRIHELGSEVDLVAGDDGRVHLALLDDNLRPWQREYGGFEPLTEPHLLYGVYEPDAQDWIVETLRGDFNQQAAAPLPSIDVEDDGTIHLAFWRSLSGYGNLWYARGKDGAWIQKPLIAGTYATPSAVAAGADGLGRVLFVNNGVNLFRETADGWTQGVIVAGVSPSEADGARDRPGLAVASDGTEHAVWYDGSADGLYYGSSSGGSWSVQRLDAPAGGGHGASLALDSQGRPHVAYAVAGAGTLVHAVLDGAAWQQQDVAGAEGVGAFTSIAIDSQDRPVIAWAHATPDAPAYAYGVDDVGLSRWDGAAWSTELPVHAGYAGRYVQVALGPDDRVHLLYQADDRWELRHTWEEDGGWSTEVAHGMDQATDPIGALAVGSDGVVHVTYGTFDPAVDNTGWAWDFRYARHQ